jgi:hypothetical protein
MKIIQTILIFLVFFTLNVKITVAQVEDILGVTLENVDNYTGNTALTRIKNSLLALPLKATSRIVFQCKGNNPLIPNPEDYNQIVPNIKQVSQIMGLVLDSWYWDSNNVKRFDYSTVIQRTQAFITEPSLVSNVDIWEIGNEVNGEWLFNGNWQEVMRTVNDACILVKNTGKKTALTLYYNTLNCVPDSAYLIYVWTNKFLTLYPDIINKLDYVFVSYYYDPCETSSPNWHELFTWLQKKFPRSHLGIGECGWVLNNQIEKKLEVINNFYSLQINFPNITGTYVRGNFYWTYQQDCVPNYASNPLWLAIYNNALKWKGVYKPESE